jgi:hypothetical protein
VIIAGDVTDPRSSSSTTTDGVFSTKSPVWEGNEMLNKLRQYLALMRRRRSFVIGLGIVLLVAIAFEVVAHTNLVWAAGQEGERALAAGFGDAFVIAFVLALLVDPAAQHQFATEWGRDLYWAIFSPNAPQEFRDAL